MVTSRFDFSNFGIDPCSLLTLGDRDLILDTFEGFVASLFIHIGNDILCEVKYTVEVATRDIEQHTQIGGDAARVPDVCNRCGKSNMTHALTADSRARYFHTALIANDSFITGVLIFTAITLPVTLGAKNSFTE